MLKEKTLDSDLIIKVSFHMKEGLSVIFLLMKVH